MVPGFLGRHKTVCSRQGNHKFEFKHLVKRSQKQMRMCKNARNRLVADFGSLSLQSRQCDLVVSSQNWLRSLLKKEQLDRSFENRACSQQPFNRAISFIIPSLSQYLRRCSGLIERRKANGWGLGCLGRSNNKTAGELQRLSEQLRPSLHITFQFPSVNPPENCAAFIEEMRAHAATKSAVLEIVIFAGSHDVQ